jgi:hypothetical protein
VTVVKSVVTGPKKKHAGVGIKVLIPHEFPLETGQVGQESNLQPAVLEDKAGSL